MLQNIQWKLDKCCCGYEGKEMIKPNEILNEDYSEQADEIRKCMVIMSHYKYGSAENNFGEGRVDAIGSCEKCLKKFRETKNTEYLLDAMNYLMFRYMFPLPGEFYRGTDSGDSAGTVGTPINFERGN